MRVTALALVMALAMPTLVVAAVDDSVAGPPPFFLQDPTDSLCLSGEDFRRCSIDTLFYVVGQPGKYQIKKRPISFESDGEDGLCISKKDCKDATKSTEVKLTKCSHCGTKNWNIIGDAETAFAITNEDGQLCLQRQESGKIMLIPCDSTQVPYTALQLQFASAADIAAMQSPAARLIGAASDGDKKLVQSLLKEGTDVNARDWDDLTALIPAASSGHLDICKLLVKEGVDVNAKDKDGITALMEASIMGHAKIVEFLLDSDAEIEGAANSGVTALWLAAGEGKTDVMKLLLKKGADASNTRIDGLSALMTASVGGHEEAAKLLLANGADATAADNDGLTALMNAAEAGNLAVVKLLVEAVDEPATYINEVSATGFNALLIAAAHGRVEVVEYLLDHGADMKPDSQQNVTPLMYAASADHVEAMKVLLDKGKVDLEAKHDNGGTAVMEAATSAANKALKLLLERGAKYDFMDLDGVTPLMTVASQGNLEGQTLILEAYKKDGREAELAEVINQPSNSGGSSIMFAAAGGHLECTKQLFDLGGRVTDIAQSKNGYAEKMEKLREEGTIMEEPHVDGQTALHVAAERGHLDTVNFLIEHGAKVDVEDEKKRSPLFLAIKGNHGDVAIALVKAGADPNTSYTDDDGEAHDLLMDAITVENEEFAKLLAESGADLYRKDARKITTLLQASHRGLTGVVKILLDKHAAGGSGHEAYLNDANDEGITPLFAAASEGHAEILKLLIDAKADVNAKDIDGTTALMASSARGHLDAVKLLIEAGANLNDQNDDGHTALMFAYNGKNQVMTLHERYAQYMKESDKGDGQTPDDAGTGPIIEEALTNHNVLVELLLKSGANVKLKDKEGHIAKDFDFHPDADAEVLMKEAVAEKMRDVSKNEL